LSLSASIEGQCNTNSCKNISSSYSACFYLNPDFALLDNHASTIDITSISFLIRF
jgi:hypothetical protein